MIHNPVLLPDDIAALASLVRLRGLSEMKKAESREPIAGRIQLFHEIIKKGLEQLQKEDSQQAGAGYVAQGAPSPDP